MEQRRIAIRFYTLVRSYDLRRALGGLIERGFEKPRKQRFHDHKPHVTIDLRIAMLSFAQTYDLPIHTSYDTVLEAGGGPNRGDFTWVARR